MATAQTNLERDASELAVYMLRARSEAGFQRAVRHFALLMGWLYYHDQDSRKNDEGFPDTVLVRDGCLVFAELKVGGNKRTARQVEWGNRLTDVENSAWHETGGPYTSPVRYFLWYPTDWEEIVRVLVKEGVTVELT